MGCNLIDITRTSIIKGGINNMFWLEVILAIIYIKNIRPISAFNSLSPNEKPDNNFPDFTHL